MAAPAWVTEVGVFATFTVATIALFGERIRQWMFPPRLHVELAYREGELEAESFVSVDDGVTRGRSRDGRHYRLRVTNSRRRSPAHDVHIVVEAIESYRPNGTTVMEYRGPIPLEWEHALAFPSARTIGSPAVANFLTVTEARTLRLRTVVAPNYFATGYSGHTKLRITVAARGLECDSESMRFIVAWDGEWDRGKTEMNNHLTIDRQLD